MLGGETCAKWPFFVLFSETLLRPLCPFETPLSDTNVLLMLPVFVIVSSLLTMVFVS